MNRDQVTHQQIDDWHWRGAAQQQRTEDQQQHLGVGAEAFEELYIALEELQIAQEELQQQNEELESTRTLVEVERQRYEELFESVLDGYLVIDIQGTIQEANHAATTLLNVSQQFLVGKPLDIFVAEAERHDFHTYITQLHFLDGAWDREVRLQPHKNVSFDAALTIATVRDQEGKPVALRVCVRDITSRKLSESALEASDRISTLMSNLPGMAYRCLIDSKYTFEFASVGCFELTGYHPSDFNVNEKLTYALVIHPEDRSRVRQEMEAALCTRRRFTIVYRIISAIGEEKWVWDRGLGIYATNGKLLATEGFVTDITERKRAEELQQAQVEALVKLNQQKDDFLSTVSHELRIPVSNMKVAVRMLEVSLKRAGIFREAEARIFTLPACRPKSIKSDAEYRKISHYLQILKDECEQEIILIDDLLNHQQIEAD